MSLSQDLFAMANQKVSNDQGEWRQFILDHLDYISARSVRYDIAPEVMHLYKHDLSRFLHSKMGRNQDIGWIVRLINNLPNDMSFDNLESIIVPTDDIITKLFNSFRTKKSNPTQL